MRTFWDAWSRGSVPEIVALLDPDIAWESTMLGREYRGHGDVTDWLEALAREWKSLTVTLESVEDCGADAAVARGRAVGFDYGGGKAFDTPMTWVAEFTGELISRARVFTDDEDAARYLASREAG